MKDWEKVKTPPEILKILRGEAILLDNREVRDLKPCTKPTLVNKKQVNRALS